MAEQGTVAPVMTGMTCDRRVMAARKSLASVPGVAHVAVTSTRRAPS